MVTTSTYETIITTKDGTGYMDRDDKKNPVELINRSDIVLDMIVKYGIDYKFEHDFDDDIAGIMTEEEMQEYISGFIHDIRDEIRSIFRRKLGDAYDPDFQVRRMHADVAVCVRLFKDGERMDPLLYDRVYDVEDGRDDVFYFSPIASLCEWNGASKSGRYVVMDTYDLVIEGIESACDSYLEDAPFPKTAIDDDKADDDKQSGKSIPGFLGRLVSSFFDAGSGKKG